MTDIEFNLGHNKAYTLSGAIAPGTQWCAFDVPRPRAEREAKCFFLTLWDDRVFQDEVTGVYWYKVTRTRKLGEGGTQRAALWTGLKIAKKNDLPIVGILKDGATSQCTLLPSFAVKGIEFRGDDAWLRLVSSEVGILNLETISFSADRAFESMETADSLESKFQRAVAEASAITTTQRWARLAKRTGIPRKIAALTYVFDRDPDVVAEVLFLAKGSCQRCGSRAPFNRKSDKTPYLEVHHRIRLADGGHDTVENAEALCPNCHRFKHYGDVEE